MRLVLLSLNLLAVSAFTSLPATSTFHRPASFLGMSSAVDVPITVTGNNIDVTPALVEYVNKKLERPLGKLRANGIIKDCSVHLIVNKNPKVKDAHRIEVTTKITGTTIHSSEESPDMYASIDNVADRLARKLVKYKERRLAGWHGGKNMGEDMASAFPDIAEEDAVAASTEEDDPFAPEVTKIRSFDLSKPIKLDEAIFALDYVDHDFYVFKDADSGDVNVVYKRNAGGVGLIQPEQ
mmetsp:Transcript_15161/g.25154  ORF Transcript_15161/g.25154 Transcript_15161/m.25154 type:complete len:238 (-) Transcript_15161:203-916(-)|eukprot:CAMPEP_0119016320 /NCGR_PEP_ID=MMETSP1176-20130426/12075_1 /TAXON_ID=265551 /ORGANISM="Synedropsis recta cf, Strain CCMP1620" /LENGTH=237 /DNA_ID=CAMNT_0006969673 /DNA_START=156 /DNA_END=869 /DNA_ORIENTATION=+